MKDFMKQNSYGALIKKYAIVIIFLGIALLFTCWSPTFATFSNMITVLRQVAVTGICCAALMCMMITGNIDLSLGNTYAFGGVLAAYLAVQCHWPLLPALLATILMCTVIGILNGIVVAYFNVNPMICTLSMANIIKGVTYMITGGLSIYELPEGFRFLGQGHVLGIPFQIVLMIAILVIVSFMLNRTFFGRYLFAVGNNKECARLSGLNVKMIELSTYALVAVAACISGFVATGRINSANPSVGATLALDCILACVLGGCSANGGEGRVSQVFFGVLTMGIISNGMNIVGLSEYVQLVCKGVLLVFSLSIDGITHARKSKGKALKSN